MKLCRFECDQEICIGVLRDEKVFRLRDIAPSLPESMAQLLQIEGLESQLALTSGQSGIPLSQIRLLAPIENPEKVICIGLNYRDHAIETNSPIPEQPVVFSKFSTSVIGPDDPIILPKASKSVDYEAELVVVIGKPAQNVSVADAMACVFGYTCGHDVSARDWQKDAPAGQWLLGKSFDTFAPIGPAIVHKSQVPDVNNLKVKMHVSGETLQDGSTRELIFGIDELVAHLSQVFTLLPGDIIFTGTPPGVGMARDPKRFLRPGDTCDVEIEGIGVLSNPCVAADSPEAVEYRGRRYGQS